MICAVGTLPSLYRRLLLQPTNYPLLVQSLEFLAKIRHLIKFLVTISAYLLI